MNNLLDGLVVDFQGAEKDQCYYSRAGQVFRTAIAIGVASIAQTPGKAESQPEWDGSQRIRKVVDRIGQQGHAAAAQGHAQLEKRRDEQHHQGDLDGKYAGAGRQGRVGQWGDGGVRMAAPMLPGRLA